GRADPSPPVGACVRSLSAPGPAVCGLSVRAGAVGGGFDRAALDNHDDDQDDLEWASYAAA
ncbi:hypothetical protein ACFUMI_13150, partial [Streptomyces sp. NPDC057273]